MCQLFAFSRMSKLVSVRERQNVSKSGLHFVCAYVHPLADLILYAMLCYVRRFDTAHTKVKVSIVTCKDVKACRRT
jgi:hypothetical protein